MSKEIKSYKLLDSNFPPNPPIKDAKLYVLNQSTNKVETYITDKFGNPKPLKDDVGSGNYTFNSSDNSITVSGTNNINLILENSLKTLINNSVQSGGNISELVNDSGYITLGDIPAPTPSDYDSLLDTPNTKVGNALKFVRVNAAETEHEYIDVNPDLHYEHNQAIASSSWNITHNLGKFPSVTVVDSAGDERDVQVNHIDNNNLTITFLSANTGKAYLN